jgi:hypothetical protein
VPPTNPGGRERQPIMSTSKTLQAHIHNDLGQKLTSYWIAHRSSSSSSPDTQYGTNLAQGGDGSNFNITIVSNSTDQWTVMWTDSSNNEFGGDRWFGAEVSITGGSVEIQIKGSGKAVEILQDSNTLGTSKIEQYGWGG